MQVRIVLSRLDKMKETFSGFKKKKKKKEKELNFISPITVFFVHTFPKKKRSIKASQSVYVCSYINKMNIVRYEVTTETQIRVVADDVPFLN